MFTYLFIFFSKIIENTLSTLRLIVVANGKKKLGAILNGIISFTWIFSTSIVIININKDILKIFFFCVGAIVGSYLGSVIEEKIALGNVILVCKVNRKYSNIICNKLNYKIIINDNDILSIYLPRKDIRKVYKTIKRIDESCFVIGIKAKNIV